MVVRSIQTHDLVSFAIDKTGRFQHLLEIIANFHIRLVRVLLSQYAPALPTDRCSIFPIINAGGYLRVQIGKLFHPVTPIIEESYEHTRRRNSGPRNLPVGNNVTRFAFVRR